MGSIQPTATLEIYQRLFFSSALATVFVLKNTDGQSTNQTTANLYCCATPE